MTDTTDGKRQDKRDSLYLTAQVSTAGAAPVSVRVRNLSAGGMLIDTEALLGSGIGPGDPVEGSLRGIGAFSGMVAWARSGRAGIAFDDDIDPKKARTRTGARTTTPAYFLTMPVKRPAVRTLR